MEEMLSLTHFFSNYTFHSIKETKRGALNLIFLLCGNAVNAQSK